MTAAGTPWGTWKYPLMWDVTATFPGGVVKYLRVEAEFPEQRRVPTGAPALPPNPSLGERSGGPSRGFPA